MFYLIFFPLRSAFRFLWYCVCFELQIWMGVHQHRKSNGREKTKRGWGYILRASYHMPIPDGYLIRAKQAKYSKAKSRNLLRNPEWARAYTYQPVNRALWMRMLYVDFQMLAFLGSNFESTLYKMWCYYCSATTTTTTKCAWMRIWLWRSITTAHNLVDIESSGINFIHLLSLRFSVSQPL